MLRPLLALATLVALSGCAELGVGTGSPWDSTRYPSSRRAPTYDGRADDYRRSSEYRRVNADAASYARYVERNLRTGRESAIRQITERHAVDLLRRTNPRDHARVYPFPRQNGRQAGFWNGVDRDVERQIGSRFRDDYRYLVRNGESRYQDRYRSQDRRYDTRSTPPGQRGREDGRRGRVGDRDDDRDDRRRRADRDDDRDDRRRRGNRDDDRRRGDRDDRDDRAQRPGESLQDWYRRQARRPR